ncbi:12167_t:CDS:2 [Funneliformis caledonium]|uniref:12167_t:CDS:1 n=1 Tax=Funneliformis caledonium TaxID=1117310 RepID=A0A9N9C7G7_9GLOM|nr:12167_t:CDS:2 [Funneliformis caledonium]
MSDKMEMEDVIFTGEDEFTQSRKELDDTSSIDEQKDLGVQSQDTFSTVIMELNQQEIKRLEGENRTLNENIESMSQELNEINDKNKKLENKYDNLIQDYEDLLQKEQEAKQCFEDLKQKLQKQPENNQRIANLRDQLREKETDIHELEQKNKNLKGKAKEAASKYKLLEAQVHDQTNDIVTLQSQLSEKENDIRELNQKLKDEISKYQSALETKTHDQPNDIATLQDQLNEKESDIRDLVKKNRELKEEASKYQSALGAATNVRLGNDDQNHSVQLKQDILDLQRTLEHYAILQRKVLEQIFDFSNKYGLYKGDNYSLETDIDLKAQELLLLIKEFSETRVGTDEVSNVATIKIRQQIYRILGNRGFSNIISPKDNSISSHNFIHIFSQVLNETINKYRQINDIERKKEVEKLAQQLIRDVCRIFWFRFLVQEPKLQNKFIESNTLVNPDLMNGRWETDELEKVCVDLCYFPLVGRDLDSNSNYKVITPAKIITRPIDQSNTDEEENEQGQQVNEKGNEGNEENEPDKVVDVKNSSLLNFVKKKMRSNSK